MFKIKIVFDSYLNQLKEAKMHWEAKLDFWIKENLNAVFCGKHGVGKTTMVKEAFERNNLKWLYFSAATMDPWVDFVGVPKEKTENGITYLELVRPKAFQTDEVEALFFDELNRAHKKVRNAVMELIQFKSINGKKFKNLKVVWAAINPDEDEDDLKYDVEKLDPAQIDRFHIRIDIPYKPDYSYFKHKYGEVMAEAACNWWKQLDKATQNLISPRRLDYALDIHNRKGDLRDVLPLKCNIGKLIKDIIFGSVEKRMKDIVASKNIEQAKAFMAEENNFEESTELLRKNTIWMDLFVPQMPEEHLATVLSPRGGSKGNPFLEFVLQRIESFETILQSLVTAGTIRNLKVSTQVTRALEQLQNDRLIKEHGYNINAPIVQNAKSKYNEFVKIVSQLASMSMENTIERVGVFSQIKEFIVPQLSAKDAHSVLGAIDSIISHSYKKTLEDHPYKDDLVLVVNTCCRSIVKSEESKGAQELAKYTHIFEHCSSIPNFMFYSHAKNTEKAVETDSASGKPVTVGKNGHVSWEMINDNWETKGKVSSNQIGEIVNAHKDWMTTINMPSDKKKKFFKQYGNYFTNKIITGISVEKSPTDVTQKYIITTKDTSTNKEDCIVFDPESEDDKTEKLPW